MNISIKQQIYIYVLFALSIIAILVLAACSFTSYSKNVPVRQSNITTYVDEVQNNLSLMRGARCKQSLDKSKYPPPDKIKCGKNACSLF